MSDIRRDEEGWLEKFEHGEWRRIPANPDTALPIMPILKGGSVGPEPEQTETEEGTVLRTEMQWSPGCFATVILLAILFLLASIAWQLHDVRHDVNAIRNGNVPGRAVYETP